MHTDTPTNIHAEFQEALATAGELSASGVAFVESKKGSLPPLAQSYVDLILASPAKLKEITADLQVRHYSFQMYNCVLAWLACLSSL